MRKTLLLLFSTVLMALPLGSFLGGCSVNLGRDRPVVVHDHHDGPGHYEETVLPDGRHDRVYVRDY